MPSSSQSTSTEPDPALLELRHAVQALAQPASHQKRLFPAGVVVADELALEFDAWCPVVLTRLETELSPAQVVALRALDSHLSSGTEAAHADIPSLWSEAALHGHSFWHATRALARAALEAFGWPVEPPPYPRGGTYVIPNAT